MKPFCRRYGCPKNLGDAGTPPPWDGAWWPLETWFDLSHLSYHTKFGHSISNHTSVIMEIRLRYLIPRFPPFKVTQGHTDRSTTYDCLLVFHCNCPISYRFRDISKFFPPHLYLTPPLRKFPLEFCNGGGAAKTIMMPLPTRMSKSVTICPFLLTEYRLWTDRQTDKQTEGRTDGETDRIGKTISRSACIASTRDNKIKYILLLPVHLGFACPWQQAWG